MKDFNYYAPTEVVFGEQSEEQVAALVRKYGGTKVLVHYGGKLSSVFPFVDEIDAKCRKSAGKRVFQMELFPEAEA